METNNQENNLSMQVEKQKSIIDKLFHKYFLFKCSFDKLWSLAAFLAVFWLVAGILAHIQIGMNLIVPVLICIALVAWAVCELRYCPPPSSDQIKRNNTHLKQDLFTFKKRYQTCAVIFVPIFVGLLVGFIFVVKIAILKNIILLQTLIDKDTITVNFACVYILYVVTWLFVIAIICLAFSRSKGIDKIVEEMDEYHI